MKNLGWAYVILFVLDSVLSIAASFVQSLSGVSNLLSTVMILFSVVVLLLAALRRLEPRWLFVTLPCGYLAVAIIIGTVMGVALAATVSPDAMPTNPTPDFISSLSGAVCT